MNDYSLQPSRDLTILIPARAGSKRVPGKNTRLLGGKPLIQWTIDAAKAANVAHVIVSTDDESAATIARGCGLRYHHRRPEHAADDAPDIAWIVDVRPLIETRYFAICRPTSPFRTASTIRRCYAAFLASDADSIRAVTRVTHPHPGKMWHYNGKLMVPVLQGAIPYTETVTVPYHSCPTQILPEVFVQNASLEMAHTWVIDQTKTISGYRIAPFFTEPTEGFDINTEADFADAERIIASGILSR